MIDLLTNVFFPEGFSVHVHTHELQFKLASFKCEVVTGDDLTALLSYVAKHNLSNVKMYLLARSVDKKTVEKKNRVEVFPLPILFRFLNKAKRNK